ncbi:MAG: hypothetical protein LBR27_10535 [Bifidobacteriaceae bacterium]|jgi:D-3-phosphoglycerate dehydrogenase|nr:hypothetical protein [Bifidobacteriaceae bacterium]
MTPQAPGAAAPEAPAIVLVTPRSLTAAGLDQVAALQPLRDLGCTLVPGPAGRQPTAADLAELLPPITHWIAGVEPITAAVLAAAPNLKVISRYGVGVDAVDLAAAAAQGITVERAVGANARGVAELALALILAGLRGTAPAHRALVEGRWERDQGRELPDCTVGVVGLGAIGRLVAGFAKALGATVLGHDPWADQGAIAAHIHHHVTLEELLAGSDVVTLHCPPPPDGRPVIAAPQLAALPPGAVLVNTARASLVDDAAVLAALNAGHLAAYGVDAYDQEPPAVTELLAHPKVIATPHLGGFTGASTRRMAELAVANVVKHVTAQG